MPSDNKKRHSSFYYIRNALVHANGAYNADRSIDQTFAGIRFKSAGKLGYTGDTTIEVAHKIHKRIEELVLKAWASHTNQTRGPNRAVQVRKEQRVYVL